ncbi:MAG: cytochrome P450, partial [Pseudomonadota bacterium]
IADGSDTQAWNRDLNLVLSNAMAHKIRLPGTRFSRGLAAKRRVHRRLLSLLPARRERGGDDLFSQLASQQDEAGTVLSDADVIDHMFGMLFAAHDTTASSLAMICWLLGRHPVWQERLRNECQNLASKLGGRELSYADLDQLVEVEWVFKEALRMYAPLQLIPRRSVVPFEFSGHRIPENTALYLIPQAVHMNPEYYPDPHTFDPTRFAPAADSTKTADPFTFVPFGRGSHMCLGMHFAYMEIKAVVYQLLLCRRLMVPDETLALEYLPIVRPTKPMVVNFEPI